MQIKDFGSIEVLSKSAGDLFLITFSFFKRWNLGQYIDQHLLLHCCCIRNAPFYTFKLFQNGLLVNTRFVISLSLF